MLRFCFDVRHLPWKNYIYRSFSQICPERSAAGAEFGQILEKVFNTPAKIQYYMGCELCGKEEPLFKAIVEGTSMQVCKNCGKFGKILAAPVSQQKRKVQQKTEQVFDVVEDFAQKIKKAREKTGKTQKEFAMELNEKESLIAKLEIGAATPSIPLAQKLEKLLGIKLVEEQVEGTVEKQQKSSVMTIGDIIKTKS